MKLYNIISALAGNQINLLSLTLPRQAALLLQPPLDIFPEYRAGGELFRR